MKQKAKKQVKEVNKTPKKSNQIWWIFFGIFFALSALFVARSPIFSFDLEKLLDCAAIELPEQAKLEGNLKPNNKLENAKHVGQNILVGPETIVFDQDGYLITGLLNGQVVRVDVNNQYKHTVIAQIGDEKPEICNDVKIHPKAECGRPLGLRLRENSSILYVADSYYGIFTVDLKTGNFKSLKNNVKLPIKKV